MLAMADATKPGELTLVGLPSEIHKYVEDHHPDWTVDLLGKGNEEGTTVKVRITAPKEVTSA